MRNRLRVPVSVRFADVDMAGHVHNAVYLHFFESARIAFLHQVVPPGWDWKSKGLILARNEIDYRKPLFLADRVEVEVSLESVSIRSFVLFYKVLRLSDADEICAEGRSVMVCFDYLAASTISIPDEWKEGMHQLVT